MPAVLDWVSNFIGTIFKLFPRIIIVKYTHAGIKFVLGKKIKKIGPGIHVYWPLVTEVEVVPVVRQINDLPTYTLTTSDEQAVIVSGVVVYDVKDVEKAIVNNFDIWSAIDDLCSICLRQVITQHTFVELIQNRAKVDDSLTLMTRERLKEFGINVQYSKLTDLAKCKVINLISPPAANMVKNKGYVFDAQ